MNSGIFFWLLLKGSLLSTGGFGNLPLLHQELLDRHWATERDFAESLTLGQVTPGPNGLWVISLGYLVDGWRGSLLALLAITLPPLLVLLLYRFYRCIQGHAAVDGFMRGLSLAVIGTFLIAMLHLFRGVGVTPQSLLILAGSLLLGSVRRLPVILLLGVAAVTGIVWK
ncbi:MAG: chromate transporter [Armatimonadetes bacterium]|nr:chromate transporter [Armatimonadota bacterium]